MGAIDFVGNRIAALIAFTIEMSNYFPSFNNKKNLQYKPILIISMVIVSCKKVAKKKETLCVL